MMVEFDTPTMGAKGVWCKMIPLGGFMHSCDYSGEKIEHLCEFNVALGIAKKNTSILGNKRNFCKFELYFTRKAPSPISQRNIIINAPNNNICL